MENILAVLLPLDRLIVKYQSDKTPISKMLPDFFNLQTEFKTFHNDKFITTEERDYLIKLDEQRMDFMYGVAHGVSYLLDPVLLIGVMLSANRCSLENALINKPIDDGQPVDYTQSRQIYLNRTNLRLRQEMIRPKVHFEFSSFADRSKTLVEWWSLF